MGSDSKIEWTHHTFNPWEGCEKVSPGCKNCYAAARDERWHDGEHWGKKAPRFLHTDSYWKQPLKWDREAKALGERHRVFCASLGDVFEDRRDLDVHRERLWPLIEQTPNLDWLLLTKRPEHVQGLIPERWRREGIPAWLGTTTEDQEHADLRIPLLLGAKARVHFLSYEPAVGPVNFNLPTGQWAAEMRLARATMIDWIIVGGESGNGARPFNVEWARSTIMQCRSAGVACLVKQLGGHLFAPWKLSWYETKENLDLDFRKWDVDPNPREWNLRAAPDGRSFATVWQAKADTGFGIGGVWHTWDAHGGGGENASSSTVELAQQAAMTALVRQHLHPLPRQGWVRHPHMLRDKKGGDWSEWPEDLRVREYPRVAP